MVNRIIYHSFFFLEGGGEEEFAFLQTSNPPILVLANLSAESFWIDWDVQSLTSQLGITLWVLKFNPLFKQAQEKSLQSQPLLAMCYIRNSVSLDLLPNQLANLLLFHS